MDNDTWNIQDPYLTAVELAERYKLSMIPLAADKGTLILEKVYTEDGEEILCRFKWAIRQIKPMPPYMIEALHKGYAPPLWAMVTGTVSGIITLDFDGAV